MAPKITGLRKPKKPAKPRTITKGQYPQRQNRQKVSKANVTVGPEKPIVTGKAKVTGAQKALPPGRQGGALAKRPSASPAQRERYVPVNVREVKPNQLPGKPPKALPPSSNPRVDAAKNKLQAASEGTRGRYRVRGPATNTVNALPPAKPTATPARGMTAAAAIGAIAEPFVAAAGDTIGRELGERVLKPVGRRLDDMMPGVNSRDEAQRRQRSTPLRQSSAAERRQAVRLEQYNPPSERQKAPSAPKLPAARQAGTQSSGYRPRTASQQPTQAMPRPKQKPASATEQAATSGIGPVKDAQQYRNMKLSIKESVRELQEMRKRSQERQKKK